MIATATNEEAAPAGKLPPLPSALAVHVAGGRHYIVMKTDDGDSTIEVEIVRSIPTNLIDPHPKNRTWCDPVAQKELVENMREHGQSTPGILRPHPEKPGRFQLIAAWRRWNACKELGRPLQAMVRDLDDVQALEQLYLENAQRENLRPMDEAELIDGMLELRDAQQHRVFTIERVAMARYGTAKPGDVKRIAQLHKLLQLPEKLREAVNTGALSLAVAFLVARIADEGDRIKAGEQVLCDPLTNLPMTVKRAGELIRSKYQVSLKGFAWMERTDLLTEDEKLAMGFTGAAGEAADGSCARCPLLAKNNPAFEGEIATGTNKGRGESGIDPLTCTRACCHQMKLENEWRGRAVEFAKEHGVPAERVMTLVQSTGIGYVLLKDKPSGQETGDWQRAQNPKNPTWETILKGSGAVLMVAADNDDTPELVCETGLAVTVGKEKYPALFASSSVGKAGTSSGLTPKDAQALAAKRDSGDLKEDEAKLLADHEALVEKGRIEKLKVEMERAIAAETKVDCLKELLEKLTEKGPGLDGAKAMVLSVTRELGFDFLEFLLGRPSDELEGDTPDYQRFEELLAEQLKGKTINEMLAIAAVASVWEDVNFSGQELAADFQAMCKAVKLDTKAVHERVKQAHKLAFKASEKSRKDALKNEGKKAPKDSSNPTDWSADKEASKTAAADGRASDDRIVLVECSSADEVEGGYFIDQVLNRGVPITEPNEHGVFKQRAVFSFHPGKKVMFTIELAQSAKGLWHAGWHYELNDASGGGLPSNFEPGYSLRCSAVRKVIEWLMQRFTNQNISAKIKPAWESAVALLKQSDDTAKAAEEAVVAFEAEPEPEIVPLDAEVDYDKVDVAAAALALKAGTGEMADFIGKKPVKQREPERFARWDALRAKILRKAGLKK